MDTSLVQLINPLVRCPPDIQKMFTPQTFEDLITSQNGMTVSRALVNVVIDQQIGQQLSVCAVLQRIMRQRLILSRLILLVRSYSSDADLSAVPTMSCFTR